MGGSEGEKGKKKKRKKEGDCARSQMTFDYKKKKEKGGRKKGRRGGEGGCLLDFLIDCLRKRLCSFKIKKEARKGKGHR